MAQHAYVIYIVTTVKMTPTDKEEERMKTLDHMIDEKFAEIFFLTKDEHNVPAGSRCEKELYDMLNQFKRHIREYCETRRKDPDGYQSEV